MKGIHQLSKKAFKKNFGFRQTVLPFCHFWYNNTSMPVVSPATYRKNRDKLFNPNKDLQYPLLLSCVPPDSMKHLVPKSVSLVETKCPKSTPSNNLHVFNEKHKNGEKDGFAVCSKPLSQLEDKSMRLIEWIELLRALGVDKIIIKILAVHPNILKVII